MSNTTTAAIADAMKLLSDGDIAGAIAVLDRSKSTEERSWTTSDVVAWNQARSFAAVMDDAQSEASRFAEQAAKARPDDASLWIAAATHAESAGEYRRCATLLQTASRASSWLTDEETRRMGEEMHARIAMLIEAEDRDPM
jgi:hypothetical protein